MPDLSPFHAYIVFVHVLGVFAFLIFHGVSVGVLFGIRAEREPERLRALLDLSTWSFAGMTIGGLVWLASGILAGFSGNYWTTGRYWIWASLAVVVVVIGLMTPLGRIYLGRVRVAVGIDTKTGKHDPTLAVEPAAIEAAVNSGKPMLVAAIGFGGIAILAWLMMFKPF
jgi:hypothetical protein